MVRFNHHIEKWIDSSVTFPQIRNAFETLPKFGRTIAEKNAIWQDLLDKSTEINCHAAFFRGTRFIEIQTDVTTNTTKTI